MGALRLDQIFHCAVQDGFPQLNKILNVFLQPNLLKLFKQNRDFQVKLPQQNILRQMLTFVTRLIFQRQLQLQRVTRYRRKA